MILVQGGLAQGKCGPVYPSNVSAVDLASVTEAKVYGVRVLRTVGISRHNLSNRALVIIMNGHADTDR